MSTRRPRLRRVRRILLVLLGVLLPTVVSFLTLGWAVSRYPAKINAVLGTQKTAALEDWYLRAAAVLAPGDMDGDGWRDGLELMLRTDPRKTRSHPGTQIRIRETPYGICLGERKTLRWGLRTAAGRDAPLPREFQVKAWTDTAVLLAKDGTGKTTPGPLMLTPNARGELELDVLINDKTVQSNNGEQGVLVVFMGVARGIPLGVGFCPTLGWRLPAYAAVFTDERGNPLAHPPDPRTRPRERKVLIATPGEGRMRYLIEARRKTPGAAWEMKAWRDERPYARPFMELCEDGSWSRDVWQAEDQLGDFEIRVVPISNVPLGAKQLGPRERE